MTNSSQQTTNRVEFSAYFLQKAYSKPTFTIIKEKLEKAIEKEAEICPELKITISRTAKYQTPYIKIESGTPDGNIQMDGYKHDVYGAVEREVQNILNELGIEIDEVDERDEAYYIEFNDMR